jgi:hypothetical protein
VRVGGRRSDAPASSTKVRRRSRGATTAVSIYFGRHPASRRRSGPLAARAGRFRPRRRPSCRWLVFVPMYDRRSTRDHRVVLFPVETVTPPEKEPSAQSSPRAAPDAMPGGFNSPPWPGIPWLCSSGVVRLLWGHNPEPRRGSAAEPSRG